MDCFATLYLRIFFWATRILILHMKRMKCRFSIFLIKLVEACRGLQAIKNVALFKRFHSYPAGEFLQRKFLSIDESHLNQGYSLAATLA
jgi:hypothetical protein